MNLVHSSPIPPEFNHSGAILAELPDSRQNPWGTVKYWVPVGLAQAHFCSWAHLAWFFIEKNVYCNKYSIFTYILLFSKCLGRQEWMDGIGSVWMMPSQLGKCFWLGLGFGAGLTGLGFPLK